MAKADKAGIFSPRRQGKALPCQQQRAGKFRHWVPWAILAAMFWMGVLPPTSATVADSCSREPHSEQELQRDAAVSALKKQIQDFEAWLRLRGVPVGTDAVPIKVSIRMVPEDGTSNRTRPELAVFAVRDIRKGEEIARFTRDVIVHCRDLESPYRTKWGAGEGPRGGGWEEYSTLAAWLLREKAKGKASPWAPYMALLPQYIPLTIFFSHEALEMLETGSTTQKTNEWRRMIHAQHQQCHPSAIAGASLAEFQWAMAVVMSRSYASAEAKLPAARVRVREQAFGSAGETEEAGEGEEVEGEEEEEEEEEEGAPEVFGGPLVFIPLADLVNHNNAENWRRFRLTPNVATSDRKGGFLFRAVRSIHKGDEVVATYGLLSNDYLLLTYGFILHPNENDNIPVAGSEASVVDMVEQRMVRGGVRELSEEDLVRAESAAGAAKVEVEKLWKEEKQATLRRARRGRKRRGAGGRDGVGEESSLEEEGKAVLFDSRAEYDLFEDKELRVWPDGHIDPRLLAALTAVSFYFPPSGAPIRKGAGAFLDMAAVANASIYFGWTWSHASCSSLIASAGPAHQHAMRSAATLLHAHLKDTLSKFSSSIEDDQRCLALVRSCQPPPKEGPGAESSELQRSCLGDALIKQGVPKQEVITALRFLLGKKSILLNVLERLQRLCIDRTSSSANHPKL